MSLIQSLIIGNQQKKAVEVTAKLAKLNRTFLENSDNELISLNDEVNFLKDYVEMERLRFESDTEFQFQIHTPKNFNLRSWQIPPMILQPLIENSIKHGVMASGNCTSIDLFLHTNGNQILEIRIENNYPKQRKKGTKGVGIGLKLVADRLSLLSELHPALFQTSFTSGVEKNDKFVARIVIEHLMEREESFKFMNQFNNGSKKQIENKGGGGKIQHTNELGATQGPKSTKITRLR
jgi:LytS/YehU family sensor histidine kinase